MEECQKKGKTKAIGVSNFSQAEMERLVKSVSIVGLKTVSTSLTVAILICFTIKASSGAPVRYDPAQADAARRTY